jgi:two-component system, response regulator YesN
MYQVLLVDPDHHSRKKIKKMLDSNSSGFVLHNYAETTVSALRLYREHQYSLILINMTTFNQDGLQVCEHIRKKSHIPIILLGGRNDYQLLRKALNLQISDYLPNPVDPDEFRTSLLHLKRRLEGNDYLSHRKSKHVRESMTSHKSVNIIEKVKTYVEEAITENITLKDISDTLHYNCSYLGQKFKSQENMTFNEYLLQQRMEKAKRLLHNSNLKIYEIANEVGYIELDWFYKKFKSYTGVSATEYRKLSIMK